MSKPRPARPALHVPPRNGARQRSADDQAEREVASVLHDIGSTLAVLLAAALFVELLASRVGG